MAAPRTDLKGAFSRRAGPQLRKGRPRLTGNLVEYLRPQTGPKLVREHAFEIVRDAIVAGRIKPGTRLVERELCEALSISRTVAREVIRHLEAERLVDVTAHRGPRVATLTPKKLREIYEIRVELEVLFVRSFIDCASDEDIARLRDILDDLKAAAERKDKGALVQVITHFLHHMILVADNEVASEIFDHLLARINMLRIMAMRAPGQIETSIVQITEIVDCIVVRDKRRAERAVRAYVNAAGASALQQLAADEEA